MLGFDKQTSIISTVSAAATLSPEFNVSGWNHVSFDIPTFASYCVSATANVYVQAAQVSGGTFRRIKDVGVYSASSGIQDWEVPASTGGYIVCCRPASRFNFMKIELSITTTAAMTFGVIAHQ